MGIKQDSLYTPFESRSIKSGLFIESQEHSMVVYTVVLNLVCARPGVSGHCTAVPGNLDSCVCTHTTLPQLYSTRGIVVVLNLVAELNLLVLNLNLVPLERYCNTRGLLDCARHILRELAHGPQRIWIGGVI